MSDIDWSAIDESYQRGHERGLEAGLEVVKSEGREWMKCIAITAIALILSGAHAVWSAYQVGYAMGQKNAAREVK